MNLYRYNDPVLFDLDVEYPEGAMGNMKRNAIVLLAKRATVATMIVSTASFTFTPAVRAIAALSVSDNQVADWSGVKTGDSYVFTFTTSDDPSSLGQRQIQIVYDDGQQHSPQDGIILTTWGGNYQVLNSWWQGIAGAQVSASGNTVTVTVPTSFFASDNFTASFGGASLSSPEMGGGIDAGADSGSGDSGDNGNGGGSGDNGSGPESGSPDGSGSESSRTDSTDTQKPDTGASAYTGIKIDGDFSDWDGVPKYDVNDVDLSGNPKGWDTVNKMAMVWDGDWVYLYFESNADDPGAVTGAGPHNDGQYAITTDLGNQTLVQLQRGPAVGGIDGATVACNNNEWAKTPHKWEVAIPASSLGNYSKTISFGMYQVEPTITGVANLKADDGGKTFDGIVYDGSYGDWDGYPHTTIQYATSGTSEHVVDARGALYADSGQQKLYGHVVTSMPAHLNEAGGEFSSAVSIRINNDDDLMLTPRFIAVDANGDINWNPTLSGLADGTYEFYLTSTTVDGTSKNINDLKSDDVIYGRAKITIGEGQDEMEWEMDIPTLAKNLHTGWGQSKNTVSIDPNDIKVFESQYGRLGQQWVTTAGVSTAPYVGIGLCAVGVAGVYGYRRRKKGTSDDGDDGLIEGLEDEGARA